MNKTQCWFLPLVFITMLSLFHPAAWAGELRVLTTIKPLHSLVAAVMSGVGTPELLIKGAGSPHDFNLRPSDARTLSKADVVFWLGENIETFLTRPLKTLAVSAQVAELSKTPGLALLARRRDAIWPDKKDDPSKRLKAEEIDPHFWLNPDNAGLLIAEIARVLSLADTMHADKYAANAAAYSLKLNRLTSELETVLAPVKTAPYIVFHDSFQYFEKRFNLKALGAIVRTPGIPPGAKRLARIREKIITAKINCVFSEPQFSSAIIQTVINKTPATMSVLDPLGVDIPAGPDAYTSHLRMIANALVSCLGQ